MPLLSKNAANQIINLLKKKRLCTTLANITVALVTDRLEIQPSLSIEERIKFC